MSRDILDRVARDRGPLTVSGAPEGLDALSLAQAARRRGGVTLFIAREDARAASFAAAIGFFDPSLPVLRLPAWDCLPYDRVSPSAETAARRAFALGRLAEQTGSEPLLVIATVSAMLQRAPERSVLGQARFAARVGQVVDLEALKRYLAVNGYARCATVAEPGDSAVRGGVMDVFPPGAEHPLRLDFFGDQLESVRAFDADTQRSVKQLDAVTLAPVSEVQLDDAAISRFRRGFVARFGAAMDDPIYSAVSAGARPQGVEHWLPLFYERTDTVFDYVGPDALIALDHQALDARDERLALIDDYHTARIDSADSAKTAKGLSAPAYRALEPDALYLTAEGWDQALEDRPVRRFSPFPEPEALDVLDIGGRQGRGFAAERAKEGANVFDALKAHVDGLYAQGKRVLIASWTQGSSDRLAGVLSDHKLGEARLGSDWDDAVGKAKTAPARIVLPLERGFETPDVAVISEQDVLGDRLSRPRKKRRAANFIAEAAALRPDDLVVHVDHGIGRYLGLKTLAVQDAPHDCLEIEYAGASKLYLPVENIELLSRYGQDAETVQLDRLGGAGWQARKAAAKKRLRDMADQLIKIAAARAAKSGEDIDPPSGLFDEFCARFPYVETDDQLSAIEDVIGDLAKGQPMDRLVCGDVGFGKTEVALRAAFVAAMSGRQVAVVAPTTLLARQHHKTFSERFRGWPITVRPLSRLVSPKEAALTREGLANGTVEIVVGTHALLAKTVKFKHLGLLIIDEEQRFGVKHKERLKELKADVHVLTLTATPIPRTLQLAMSGIRELSLIATPPVDRLAVRTYVTPFDPVTVREALLREKYRAGQSFFVVPRVKDIPDVETFLRERVPEVSFISAHGQMASTRLEEVMTAFYEGRYDVLLATTIVESGLDIPTANTLVVHRADMFGLAQLYQIRGRVGRSKTRAYAYLTTPNDKKLTPGAERRLKVLSSLDTLGAGFTLARHDLDLRGGGNLLGEEQSGHIKDVGVELYQSMLEEAVASLKGEDVDESRDWSPQINIGAAVLIPDTYVEDLDVRLSLYRRLSDLDTKADREAFAAELIDRFGPLPEEAEQLLRVVGIKAQCKRCGAAKIDAGPKGAVVTFRPNAFEDPTGLVQLVARRAADFKLRPDQTLVVRGGWASAEARITGVERAMALIVDAAKAA
ncbi:MAG: transcription-repair coupling factor [Maricaulaceae bacterium]